MRRQLRSNSNAGYSLVEILVVVGMIGVLTLVTVPNFISLFRASRMKNSLRTFTTVTRNARMTAVTRGERTKITYVPSGTKYQMFESRDGGTTWTQLGNDYNLESRVYFSTTGTFTDQDTDTNPDVIFFPNGTVSPVPDSATNSGNVVLRTDDKIMYNQYTVNINNTGRLATTPARWN
jgi:type II secretion system protein H